MNKKNTLLLQLFSIAVLLFFLFQMLGPAISNFLSFGHSKITTQHVVGNGTITAFLSSARFVPSSDNGKYVTILSNLTANGTINYHEQESGATTFYEITFSNASNIGVVRDMLSPYGTFLVRASIKPLNSTNMQLSLLVSGYHSVGDTVPVQYDVEMRDDKVLSISNGALLPSNIAIDQDVNITDTGAVTLEVYLPSEDDDFVNLMKKYNVSVSYLPINNKYRFKTRLLNITSPKQVYGEVSSIVNEKNGTLKFSEEVSVAPQTQLGRIPLSLESSKGYNKGDYVHLNANMLALEGIVLQINNYTINTVNQTG